MRMPFLMSCHPSLIEGWSRQLEVVNIDNQEEVKALVVVATSPVWDIFEADRQEVRFAMLFPVLPGFGVAV